MSIHDYNLLSKFLILARGLFIRIALKDNFSDIVSLYTDLFDESFNGLCRGLVVCNYTIGQTWYSYILVVVLNYLILNRPSHQDLKQHSLHPLHSKAHLDHSYQNPSLQTALCALESSLSFEDTNHAATAPNMAVDSSSIILVECTLQ